MAAVAEQQPDERAPGTTAADQQQGMDVAKDGWYTELGSMWPGQGLSLKDICVFESEANGHVLLLDGVIQVTDRDEFADQEMTTHVPLCALQTAAKRALVVGGGDGGVLRELARHTSLEEIHIAEIDSGVIEVCKKYFPGMAVGFQDPRVTVHICDGCKFVQEAAEGSYDVIIVDCSDPVGPAQVLFQQPFFEALHRALRPGGIVCTQAESLWLHLELIQSLAAMCNKVFEGGSVSYYYYYVPTYPSGMIGMMVCCKGCPLDPCEPRQPPPGPLPEQNIPPLRYYNSQVMAAPLMYGWLLSDLVHICVPQLRAAVLLFITAPLPYLNPAAVLAVWARRPLRGSGAGGGGVGVGAGNLARPPWFAWTQPSWYCQVPGLRTWLVVLQRLLRPAGAALSVGLITPGCLRFSILAFWARHTQYLYLGWIACMMRVSFKLQLILGLFEWLLTLYASTAMHAQPLASSNEDGSVSGHTEGLLSSPRALQQLWPMLQQLLGEEEAAQTLAAVFAAKTTAIRPSLYQAVSTCLNVSVKVHFGQESLELVSPVLHSTVQQWLLQQVADDTAQSIAAAATPLARVTAVCFSGCVHLLANLYTIKPAAAAAVQADIEAGQVALEVAAAAERPAAGGSVRPAAGLLCAVQQGGDAAVGIHPTLAAARSLLKAVALSLTAAGFPVAFGSGRSGGLIETGGSTADKAVILKTADEAEESCHLTVSLGQSELTGPCCLMAAQDGQVLQLAVQSTTAVNTSSAAGASLRCSMNNVRVLIFQHRSLLLDEQVPVADIIRVGPLPALSAGALHVAVLPLASPSSGGPPTSLLGSAVSGVAEAPSSTAASAVPLLLQPVLVLPEPAALELEQYWQCAAAGLVQADPVTAAARDVKGKVTTMEKLVQLHDVWEAVMSGVVCDVTYLVSGSPHHVRDVPIASEPPVGCSSTAVRASSSLSCSRVAQGASKAADCCAGLGPCGPDSVDYDRSSDIGCGWSPAGAEAAASSSYTASQAGEATDCNPLVSRVEQMLLTRLMAHLATQKLWKVMEAILNLVASATAETNGPG
eukprot:gene2798-3091_t